MKTLLIYLTMIGLFAMSNLSAQIPQAFKYQAAIRDTTGQVLQNKLISLRISILKGDVEGEEVYSEIHDVWTDQFGLVSLNIGQGLDVSRDFSTIPWGEDTFFLQIEMDMDGAMNYHLLGTSQLMAVPYALYAERSGNELWKTSEKGIFYNDGNVEVGNNLTITKDGHLDIFGDGSYDPIFTLSNNSHTRISALTATNKKYYRPAFEGLRARGTIDNPKDLQAGDCVFSLSARPYFNGLFRQSAEIAFYAGNNPGLSSYPAYISFQTTKPNDTIRYERMRITEDGKVGIGTDDPGAQKLFVETNAYGDDRAIAHFRNDNKSTKSLCNVYISSGDGGSTYLNFTSSSYIHQGGKYKSHTLLGNNGKGLVFRSGQNDEGRFAFEFRREMGTTYIYDEKVSITYDGNMGIGVIHPKRKLHINDVMRLEPRYAPPENPSEGDIYMDGSEHVLKVFNGTEWKACW